MNNALDRAYAKTGPFAFGNYRYPDARLGVCGAELASPVTGRGRPSLDAARNARQ
ncbi:MAG: hypothetical protein IPF50_00600 [Proteobacteria bacterium]|nr:hypothetical protein [Pseudomonadota bacterium]